MDDLHPYGASAFIPGSAQEKLVRGKRTSVVQWDHFSKLGEYQAKVVEAYGFPQGEKKGERRKATTIACFQRPESPRKVTDMECAYGDLTSYSASAFHRRAQLQEN